MQPDDVAVAIGMLIVVEPRTRSVNRHVGRVPFVSVYTRSTSTSGAHCELLGPVKLAVVGERMFCDSPMDTSERIRRTVTDARTLVQSPAPRLIVYVIVLPLPAHEHSE